MSLSTLQAARDADVDFVPGVATASLVKRSLALLKPLGGPFPQVRFCTTGGLNPGIFGDYLALPNVIYCGGSWMVGAELVDNGFWDEIEMLARAAIAGLQAT